MRYFQIDFLRAASILGMIAIHVYAYTWVSAFDNLVWNWLHFVVVGFVFCSGFVLFARYGDISRREVVRWWKRRIVRLLVPYYVYIVVHGLLLFILPGLFEGLDLRRDVFFLLSSFTLFGGTAISWLPLLFIQMMLLFPLLVWLWRRRVYLSIYLLVAVLVTGYFTFFSFPYEYYRYVMWLPWSLVMLLSFLYFELLRQYKTSFLPLLLGAGVGVIFLTFVPVWDVMGKSYTLTSSKYPPNFFYLLYACAISLFVMYLGGFSVWRTKYLRRFVSFVSMQSYTLFFVHYVVLDFVLVTRPYTGFGNPFVILLIVGAVSLVVTYVLSDYSRVYSYLWERGKNNLL